MTENKTTLLQRLKKSMANPLVIGAIAGISYFAGLKQNNSNDLNDSFDRLREAMGGEITHGVLEGVNGSKTEFFLNGDDARAIFKDANGLETKGAWDLEKGEGILSTSTGMTMRTENGQWVEGKLTEAQKSTLDNMGKTNSNTVVQAQLKAQHR